MFCAGLLLFTALVTKISFRVELNERGIASPSASLKLNANPSKSPVFVLLLPVDDRSSVKTLVPRPPIVSVISGSVVSGTVL